MKSILHSQESDEFGFIFSNVAGLLDGGIAIAASRAGATGILNCESVIDIPIIRKAIERVSRYARGSFGIKLEIDSPVTIELLTYLADQDCIVLVASGASADNFKEVVTLARAKAKRLLIEVTSENAARSAAAWPVDGLIAKGHEAGGAVGEETTFILLQRLLREFTLPVWAHGGIGLHSSAACYVAGAAGVVLDSQLLLLAESSLPPRVRTAVERIEGDETVTLGRELGSLFRLYRRPGLVSIDGLQELERELSVKPAAEGARQWRDDFRNRINWEKPEAFMWPIGQDSAFAAPLAARFGNVSALLTGLREAIAGHVAAARQCSPLGSGSALARAHGTEFPVLQGPMTRVSDAAGFADAVARGGGLPFLALALLRGPQVRELLSETSRIVGDRPWGIGILGFVPSDLRAEQLEVAREFRPPFAIIAGGRPDQAASLEREGTTCYLHVPAPALLELFVKDGARRFIFEGRECGGHIGPRTSFVLWESMIEVLLRAIKSGIPGDEFHIAFAGGIHDALSTAMVAAMSAPLVERGVRVGVLMGTAYLFTREAVEAGAIVQSFQEVAMNCSRTVVLETGPGHATRCAETPFYDTFREARRLLAGTRKPHEEIREELEQLNLGRLRVASKGITRNSDPSTGSRYVDVSLDDQRREGMYMIGQVAALRDRVCTIRDLHEEASEGGNAYLQSTKIPAWKAADEAPAEAPCDIAIVGMSCVLPKAPDVRSFWANQLNKIDAITEIPAERFNIDLYYDPDKKAKDKIYTRWGGFIDDVPFEPLRYGIPPNALGSIDPMQLLSLIMVDRALDDAGYKDREFPRQKTSVIFGTSGGLGDMGGHYAVRASLTELISDPPAGLLDQLPEWTEDSFAGLLPNVAAGRVANRFDLGGVNFTVDAACASSLAATYVAARELTTRSSDMVIVGGVDTVQSPFCFLCFAKAGALSPGGRCRPFDETADGIAISEGITVLVMKRLEDAERDGDRIYSVIKAISGSSDGRGRSMTAPRIEGQKLGMKRAYRQAGFSAATVGLMEAHGTGTAAGDATEMESLSQILREAGSTEQSCAVGSVKSMVGHTKAAAGVTGLMKISLAAYHKVLPPTLHVEKPNARLSQPGSPLYVNSEARPWLPPVEAPRRAGVSSFGFGGTNFHAVIEEYTGDFRNPADRAEDVWPAELFVWNAASADALQSSLAVLVAKLDRGATPELAELAASVCRRADLRRPGRVRLGLVASSLEDLTAKLGRVREVLAAGQDRLSESGIHLAPGAQQPGEVAFLFPGQGSQYPGMMRDLAIYFPEFRDKLQTADRVLADSLPRALSSMIYPPPTFTPEKKKEQMQALTDTLVAQPALGVVEIALVRLLERLGISPSMTAGHSYGEYAALCAAGVFSEETLFRLSEARGRAIKETTGEDAGIMVAAEGSAETVAKAVNGTERITVANYNSPRQTVLAGPSDQLSTLLKSLKSAGITAVQIPVACAFHSPFVAPARNRLASALAGASFASPHCAVFSNSLGARYPENPEEIAGVLSEHLVNPVRFIDEIQAMYQQGARTFVEVGPKGVLTGLSKQILGASDAACIQVDVNGRHGVISLLEALAQLVARGVPVEIEELFRGRSVTRLDLDRIEPRIQSAAQWMVNGGRSYQGLKTPQLKKPIDIMRTVEVEKIVEVHVPVLAEQPSSPVTPVAVSATAPPAVPAGSDVDGLMTSFHQLMGQFLHTQAAVTMAYLQGAPGVGAPAQPPVAFAPSQVALAPAAPVAPVPVAPLAVIAAPVVHRVVPVRAPAPVPQAKVVPAPPPLPPPVQTRVVQDRNVLTDLTRIASERTGYPVEVLDANAAIEADLGIDSIKRVEILSSFQQLCTPDEQIGVQSVMEKLTPAASLRAMADLIAATLDAVPRTTTVAPLVKASASLLRPASAQRNILGELVRISSDRTGYPVDVLDVNAAIEADLGIDSIKRVEILSSFQQLCTPDEQSRVQSVMEKLTPAPSLKAMADLIAATLGTVTSLAAPTVVTARAAAPQRNVLGELVRIASERTGYPVEVLDVNAAIEADLGIDSIKRVEILSSFQQLCTPGEQTRVQSVMEKLTPAPSLKAISDLITAVLGGAVTGNPAVAQPAAPSQAPVEITARKPVATAPRREVLGEIVRIASERTGYPADVLDINAAIEADLGIDSIKRVEILSSFQQLCTSDEQRCVQSVMEKLTPAPSLKAIADIITAVLGKGAEAKPLAQPEVQPVAAPVASRRDVLGDLLRIASDRTGYPVEVLDVNAAIEADLGIDSIKRVEILSSFQQLCTPEEQAKVQSAMEKLTPAPTLRAIADHITAVLGAPADLPRKSSVAIDIPRFSFTAVDRPRRGTMKHFPGRLCLITDDETGIAAGIAHAWTRMGERVVLLRQSADAPLAATGVFSGDLKDPSVVNALVQSVRSQYGAIGALIHLLPLRSETALPRNGLAEWRNQLHFDLKTLYALVRACESDLRETGEAGGALVAVATGRGGAFGFDGEASLAALPGHQAMADFCRTATMEISEARFKIVDLDMTDPTMILREKLLDELGSRDTTLEIGLPGDQRLTPAIQLAPVSEQRRHVIDSDWVCLLTGGARGITAAVAKLLAERHRPTLVIVGTTPFSSEEEPGTAGITDPARLKKVLLERLQESGAAFRPADVTDQMKRLLREREIRATLQSLRKAGSRVEYHAVDVRDESAFGGLIDDLYARYGRIDAVVHGAGIIEDKLIRDKGPESFDNVVHTKADSSWILADKLRPSSLKCFLLMSSVTAAFGNRGQADYGAANGVMNGFARQLAKGWPASVVAVNWGPWDQANMVSDHIRRQFVAGGIQIIPLEAGAEAAVREIENVSERDSVVVLGGGPWREKALPAQVLHRVAVASTL